jgi:hypothetical protein
MSDPVQCVVSYPPLQFFTVSVQTPAGFPVTLPEAPAPEVELNEPVSVSVVFVNGGPVQVIVLPATGPQGPAGPAGTGKTWVAITSDDYDALTSGERNDSSKVYDITDFTW